MPTLIVGIFSFLKVCSLVDQRGPEIKGTLLSPPLTSSAFSVKIPGSSRSVATEPGTSPFCQAWRINNATALT
jgi:hypothetical protein